MAAEGVVFPPCGACFHNTYLKNGVRRVGTFYHICYTFVTVLLGVGNGKKLLCILHTNIFLGNKIVCCLKAVTWMR